MDVPDLPDLGKILGNLLNPPPRRQTRRQISRSHTTGISSAERARRRKKNKTARASRKANR